MDNPKITSLEQFQSWALENGSHGAAEMATEGSWWHERERLRLLYGTYNPLPIEVVRLIAKHTNDCLKSVHWIHASKEVPGMIAYTPDDKSGKADRQIRTKLGRYLKNTSGLTLSDPDIATISALLRSLMAPPILLIANTEEEIAHVFDEGPRSCMGGEGRAFAHDVAPVRVYAGPDTAVAYIEREGRITARTVIRTDTAEWIRIYGDEIALETALAEGGYTEGRSLSGCRLADVEYDGRTVMPYLDGEAYYVHEYTCPEHDKLFWRVCNDGDYSAQSEHGFLDGEPGEETSCCEDCRDSVAADYISFVESVDRYVCHDCIENSYVSVYAGQYQEMMHENDPEILGAYDGEYYTAAGVEYHGLVYVDNDLHSIDDVCEDALTGDYILLESATEYTDASGESCYTVETDDLVESKLERCYYVKEDCYQLHDGDYVLEDSDAAKEDADQMHLLEENKEAVHAEI